MPEPRKCRGNREAAKEMVARASLNCSWRRLAFVALVIVLGAGSLGASSPAIADTGAADPYIDQLAEAADTPTLSWADCGDGFLCATAEVPLNYNRPDDEQIDLAVIKLPATDPGNANRNAIHQFRGSRSVRR